ncbi:hypothetical protein [Arthrobacter humicola]
MQQLVEICRASGQADGQDDAVIDIHPFVEGIVHEDVRDGMAEVLRCGVGMHQIGLHQLDAVRQAYNGALKIALCQARFLDFHIWKLSQEATRTSRRFHI